MKQLGWFLALLWFQVALTSAQAGDPELVAGQKLLEEGRTTLADKVLNDARASLLQLTQKNPGNAVYFYELARVDYYRCNAADVRGDKKAAETTLDQALSDDPACETSDRHNPSSPSAAADQSGAPYPPAHRDRAFHPHNAPCVARPASPRPSPLNRSPSPSAPSA